MIGILAQATVEGVAIGGVGATVLAVVALFVKRGFSFRVGGGDKESDETAAAVMGKCPLHDGLQADVAEIKADLKRLLFHLLGEKRD